MRDWVVFPALSVPSSTIILPFAATIARLIEASIKRHCLLSTGIIRHKLTSTENTVLRCCQMYADSFSSCTLGNMLVSFLAPLSLQDSRSDPIHMQDHIT